jgi:hypothetical protein
MFEFEKTIGLATLYSAWQKVSGKSASIGVDGIGSKRQRSISLGNS